MGREPGFWELRAWDISIVTFTTMINTSTTISMITVIIVSVIYSYCDFY